MGRPQFSSPEKEAIDSIDFSVAGVNDAVDGLQTVVNELKNTDVANMADNIASISTWNKYTPFKAVGIDFYNAALTDVVKIDGAGYITELVICPTGTQGIMFEIWIDGVKVLWNTLQTSTQYTLFGFVFSAGLVGSSGSEYNAPMGGGSVLSTRRTVNPYSKSLVDFPRNCDANLANGLCEILLEPLRFDTNVTLKIRNVNAASFAQYSVIGGVI